VAVHGDEDFGEGDQIDGGGCYLVALYRWGITPWGGADGEGGGGYGSPRPCLIVSPGTVFVEHPHLPAA